MSSHPRVEAGRRPAADGQLPTADRQLPPPRRPAICNLLPLLLLLLALAPAGAQGWEDTFDAPALDARWTWRVPAEGPTYSLKERPGWLRITIPARDNGFNHWNDPAPVDLAPQLRAAAPRGDWEVETRIQLPDPVPQANFHIGLVTGTVDTQILTWGPFFGPGLPGGQQAPGVWLEPTGSSGYGKVTTDARDVVLRLTKVGREVQAAVRHGDGDWMEGGTYTFAQAPRFLGIIGKTFLKGMGISFDVDYVKVIQREPRTEAPLDATVKVDAAAKPDPVNRLCLGHFIEPLGRCIYGGLWAEMLANRKFAGQAGAAGVLEGWSAVGAGPDVTFAPDNQVFYAPVQCQRITRAAAGAPCGISQGGLALRAGVGLAGRVVLRAEGAVGPVTLSLSAGGRVVAEQRLADVGAEWGTHPFTFPAPDVAVTNATFSVTFSGAGTLRVGAASLMPADNVDGWRKDVLEMAQAIRPAVMRWPGGTTADLYHWGDGVGPRDLRPARWINAWSTWDPNDVGTHEFVRLCELTGAQPYIVANVGVGDAREAARWVEYCNSRQGAEARLRAENGHPEPFAVRLWGLGHELYNKTQPGAVPANVYALRALEFAGALRAADPQVKVVGDGIAANAPDEWNTRLLAAAGPSLDYLSLHYYCPFDPTAGPLNTYTAAVTGAAALERMVQRTSDAIAAALPAGKRPTIALDEWDTWPGDANPQTGIEMNHTLADGLFACSMFNAFVRLGDRLGFANLALLVNALGAIRTTPTGAYGTPVYLAFRLQADRIGTGRLPVTVDCLPAPLPGARDFPMLDAVATVSADGRKLFLSLVNRHALRPARVSLELQGFKPTAGEWAGLVGEDILTVNTPDEPDAVRIETHPLGAGEMKSFLVPPHAAVVVTLTRG